MTDQVQRRGSASATRQNAVATGPVSLTLTNSGEAPIAMAPARRHTTARRCWYRSRPVSRTAGIRGARGGLVFDGDARTHGASTIHEQAQREPAGALPSFATIDHCFSLVAPEPGRPPASQ